MKHLCFCFICGTILIDTRPNRRSKLYEVEASTLETEYCDINESYFCKCGCDDLKTINSDRDFVKASERKEIKRQKEESYKQAADTNTLLNLKVKSPFSSGKF